MNAFQSNAFQPTAFQSEGIVSTMTLTLPINCVLIGDQVYKTGRTFEGPKETKLTFRPRMWISKE